MITEKCTLRCEKCCQFYPYYKNRRNITFNDFKHELELCFKTIDYVSAVALCGGDTMCNPELGTMLEWIGENYLGSKIGMLEIVSNAVLLPDENLLIALQKYNVYFRFTDYGDQATQKIKDVVTLLESHNIRYDHVKYSQWFDLVYPKESNGLHDEMALQKHFDRCDRHCCQAYFKGKFFYCCLAVGADAIGYCPASEDDYFDLSLPAIDKKIFMEFALGYSNKGYLNYCKKCNGSFNNNAKKIPAGVQLKTL
jgi:hypothetical protein